MPVTIKSAAHPAKEWSLDRVSSSANLLLRTGNMKPSDVGDILDTSVTEEMVAAEHITPKTNGLVHAVYQAYTGHHHLIIRPEDVWFAVLSQFSFYVNKNAEQLRSSFVRHEGKRGLVVRSEELESYGAFCKCMTNNIQQNIVDPELRAWVLPSFTTTTADDEVVASVLMMGMLQKYFEYVFNPCTCGIPTVTLLGEREDYTDMLRRIEKLTEYGEEPTLFAGLLRPVLQSMVACFDAPADDPTVVDFWSRAVHYMSGSGSDTLTGWVAAFCFWDEDGDTVAPDWQIGRMQKKLAERHAEPNGGIDGVIYHEVEMEKMPAGYVTCPVTIMDDAGFITEAKLLAGSVGFRSAPTLEFFDRAPAPARTRTRTHLSRRDSLSSLIKRVLCFGTSGEKRPDVKQKGKEIESGSKVEAERKTDTMQPVTGWWLYKVPGGETVTSQYDYLSKKMEDWKGGVSVMTVNKRGEVERVADNLEDYWTDRS